MREKIIFKKGEEKKIFEENIRVLKLKIKFLNVFIASRNLPASIRNPPKFIPASKPFYKD